MKQDQNKPREKCRHCKDDIAVRNPSGYCDHLEYPSYCKHCTDMNRTKEIEEMLWKGVFNKPKPNLPYRNEEDLINKLLKINLEKSESHIKQELIAEIKRRISKLTTYRVDYGREYIHLGHLKRILSEL